MMRPDNPVIVQSDRTIMLHTVRSVVDRLGHVRETQLRRAAGAADIVDDLFFAGNLERQLDAGPGRDPVSPGARRIDNSAG